MAFSAMAGQPHVRIACLRLFTKILRPCCSLINNQIQNGTARSILHGTNILPALSQPCRPMCIRVTYLNRKKPPEKKPFVNPLKQPKMKDATVSVESILEKHTLEDDNDMPLSDLPNPYENPPARCILCEQDVQLDYKNTRLMSQFVSPHTGQIYGRHITGLCIYMQRRVAKLIKRSRYFGFMPYIYKEPTYLRDPKLFDPFKQQ